MDFTRYDQTIQELYRRQKSYLQMADPKVISVIRKLLKHARDLRDEELTGYAYHSFSFAEYFITGRYDAFLKYARLAAEHLFRCDDRSELMHVYYLVGIDAHNKGLHDIAYHLFLTARNIAEETGQTTSAAILDEDIGHILLLIGDYKEARVYLKNSLRIVRRDPSHPHYYNNVTSCFMNDAEACLRLGLIREAKKDYEKTGQFMEKHPNAFQPDARINFALLGVKIAVVDQDGALVRTRFETLLEQIGQIPQIGIYINDLRQLTDLLIRAGEVSLAGRLVRALEKKPIADDAAEPQRLLLEAKLAYFTATGQRKALMACYAEQDRVYARLVEEQKNSTQYTKTLISLANELQKKQGIVTTRQKELLHRTRTDALTGLPNRYAANLRMDHLLEKAKREQTVFVAGILDLDALKEYNDRYGHAAGDRLLQELGDAMRELMKDQRVFVARYGGDEFVVLCDDMPLKEIRAALRRVQKNTKISFSAGFFADIPGDSTKVWDLLSRADQELYRIKKRKHASRSIEPDRGDQRRRRKEHQQ